MEPTQKNETGLLRVLAERITATDKLIPMAICHQWCQAMTVQARTTNESTWINELSRKSQGLFLGNYR